MSTNPPRDYEALLPNAQKAARADYLDYYHKIRADVGSDLWSMIWLRGFFCAVKAQDLAMQPPAPAVHIDRCIVESGGIDFTPQPRFYGGDGKLEPERVRAPSPRPDPAVSIPAQTSSPAPTVRREPTDLELLRVIRNIRGYCRGMGDLDIYPPRDMLLEQLQAWAESLEAVERRMAEARAPAVEPAAALTLTMLELREALEACGSDDDEAETVVVLTRRKAFTSTEGEAMDAGLYLHFGEYPEEGVIGPLGTAAKEPRL